MNNRKTFLPTLFLLVILTSCTLLPAINPLAPTPTLNEQEVLGTSVAATLAIQSQVAQVVMATQAAQTQVALRVQETFAAETQMAVYVQQTLAALATPTPSATLTPSITPSPTPSLTPVIPMVSVASVTNCRSGPGLAYELLGVLDPGETTEVLGRTTVENYWLVRNPDSPTQICWLWGQYATISGNVSTLPVATPPPTPTPDVAFSAAYLSTLVCSGTYAFRIQITNTGPLTWRSYRMVITDLNTSDTRTFSDNGFTDFKTCAAPSDVQMDLSPTEIGVIVNRGTSRFTTNPAGHSISVELTLCTENGLTGQCATRKIAFRP